MKVHDLLQNCTFRQNVRDFYSIISCNPDSLLGLGSQDPPLFPALIETRNKEKRGKSRGNQGQETRGKGMELREEW